MPRRVYKKLQVAMDPDRNIDRCSFDSATGRMYNRPIVIRDGQREDKPLGICLYHSTEITDLVVCAGFQLRHIFGGWDARG